MKLSITLPSLFPMPLRRALNNLLDATRCDFEILVVSPFIPPVKDKRIKWIKETERRGCNAAAHEAFNYASGEFIFTFVDDQVLVDGWDSLVLKNFDKRESLTNGLFCLGLRHHLPGCIGTVFGIYYPYYIFMRRSVIMKVGGWLNPHYYSGYSDIDLALRVWSLGGKCEFSENPLLIDNSDNMNIIKSDITNFSHDLSDNELFLNTWGAKYGSGWDLGYLRGYNRDIIPEHHPKICNLSERTIYFNDPKFLDIIQ